MRVLHLFSNHKWTGPAEPALTLCLELKRQGIDVSFACSPGPKNCSNKIVSTAREHGLEPLQFMQLNKHRNPIYNFFDSRHLRNYLSHIRYDLVHCHLDNDHDIACSAIADLPVFLVRTNHYGTGMPFTKRHFRLIKKTHALIEPSQMAVDADSLNFNVPTENLFVIHNAIDINRFCPDRILPDMRTTLNIPANAFVLGIVARMQTHRHYEELFEAFTAFSRTVPNAHLVVVGRGTKQEQVGFKPVKLHGLQEKVHFPGYLDGDDFVGTLNLFDAGIFLTPGTDGTCRAAREIMCMGKAMIVADRGMLREIVDHEHNGIVTDGSVSGLENAMKKIFDNPDLLRIFGKNARKKAIECYSPEQQAINTINAYEDILLGRK